MKIESGQLYRISAGPDDDAGCPCYVEGPDGEGQPDGWLHMEELVMVIGTSDVPFLGTARHDAWDPYVVVSLLDGGMRVVVARSALLGCVTCV